MITMSARDILYRLQRSKLITGFRLTVNPTQDDSGMWYVGASANVYLEGLCGFAMCQTKGGGEKEACWSLLNMVVPSELHLPYDVGMRANSSAQCYAT